MDHLHEIIRIAYRGKEDSVNLFCICGRTDTIGTWHTMLPSTWAETDMNILLERSEHVIQTKTDWNQDGK